MCKPLALSSNVELDLAHKCSPKPDDKLSKRLSDLFYCHITVTRPSIHPILSPNNIGELTTSGFLFHPDPLAALCFSISMCKDFSVFFCRFHL